MSKSEARDDSHKAQLSANAIKRVQETYSWDHITDLYAKLFEAELQKKRPSQTR